LDRYQPLESAKASVAERIKGGHMQISDILRRKGHHVATLDENKTVHDAILELNRHGIGALVVTGEDGKTSGIVTERDILKECGERCEHLAGTSKAHASPCPTLVGDAMTRDLVIGVTGDDLDYVMGIMTKNRIRHLPVFEAEELVGIVSIGDVVNAHVEETEFENRQLKDYISGA
jgi:CBS domain-containing protein